MASHTEFLTGPVGVYSPPARLLAKEFNAFFGYDLGQPVLADRAALSIQFVQFVSVRTPSCYGQHATLSSPARPAISGGRSEQWEYGLNGLKEQ